MSNTLRKSLTVVFCSILTASAAFATDAATPRVKLTAAEIAEKNVAARGGLEAWRAVKSITMTGRMAAGGNQRAPLPAAATGPHAATPVAMPTRLAEEAQLPFTLELKRPRKTRLELQFKGQTALQVYDGTNGWKLRPYLNRLEVENFNPDEVKAASQQSELDGLLVDYAAKGTKIEVEGIEKVENKDNYKLKLTLATGHTTHVWVDAQTFLETKVEGQPRRLDGVIHPVEVYYRDYKAVNGLQIPFLLETRVVPVSAKTNQPRSFVNTNYPPEKIVVEKVTVNPNLDDSLFLKPDVKRAALAH